MPALHYAKTVSVAAAVAPAKRLHWRLAVGGVSVAFLLSACGK